MATTPIWQANPGQGGSGPGASGSGGPGQGGQGPGGAGQYAPGQYAPGQYALGQGAPGQETPGQGAPLQATPHQGADARGFLNALFDFSFTSFVTTRIIKVLYVLILILTSLGALIYTILAFKVSPLFGLLTLVIGDPLFIIIVMAFWRLVLESFVVVFRIAEDVHAMRDRSDR